jgi:hypothetical protein
LALGNLALGRIEYISSIHTLSFELKNLSTISHNSTIGRRVGRRRWDGLTSVSMAAETSEISMTEYKVIWSHLGLNILVGRIARRRFRGAGGGDRDRGFVGAKEGEEGGEGRV